MGIFCPHCSSQSFKLNGRTKGGRQRYLCLSCRRSFVETAGTIFYYRKIKGETFVNSIMKM